MSLLKSLARSLAQQVSGRRTWTPAEVRDLIDRKAFDEARQALKQLPVELEGQEAVRESLLGEMLFQQRDDEGALQAFRRALKLRPVLASAHYGLSLLMAEAGDLEDALRHAFFADSVEPGNARFCAQVGYCQLRLGNHPLAEGPLRRATVLMPNDAHVWNNLGLALLAKGSLEEAHDCLRLAVTLVPGFQPATENLKQLEVGLREGLGLAPDAIVTTARPKETKIFEETLLHGVHALEHEGALQGAIDACEALALAHPDDPRLAIELNRLYQRGGDPASGINALEAFRAEHPEEMAVTGALGLAQLKLHRHKEAEALVSLAVAAMPDDVELNLGMVLALMGQDRFDDAAVWAEQALTLAPDHIGIRSMHAANLANQCRYEETLVACDELEALGAPIAARGMALSYLGRFEEAEAQFERALEQRPNDPLMRFQRANLRLLLHDFERGWADYAYRGFSNASNFRVLPFPLWRGESLGGKKVLVLAEQGLGDQIMFASCLPDLLAAEPSEVVLEAVNRIARTLQRSFPQCRVIGTGQSRQLDWLKDCPDVDFYIPLGDLPRHYRSSIDSLPQHDGYLRADPGRVAHWHQKLVESGAGPYLGFSWRGGTEGTRAKLRTMKLLDFAPLAEARPGTWVCLQYGDVSEEVALAKQSGFDVRYWPEAISDLDEFAALIAALDLIVTVCNTTVHYAGALGKPVWVLAPRVPEWRYGATGSTMPWYPSATVRRQDVDGDWATLMEVVRQDLSAWTLVA